MEGYVTGSIDTLSGVEVDARYRLETRIGSGAVGVVYRAKHIDLGKLVAIKLLRSAWNAHAEVARRFRREATALSQLSHPHIVSVIDYGLVDLQDGITSPYLVMEFLEGTTLEDLLRQGAPPWEQGYTIAVGVARALAYAHSKGILHRDLKPANVFLVRDGEHVHPKLLDFGLAKITENESTSPGEATMTQLGTVVGTPAYMAPEQASGERVDARADVYAFGVILFELITGRAPFVSEAKVELIRSHLTEPIPDPRTIRPDLVLSKAFEQFLDRLLSKDPKRRPRDGSQLLEELSTLGRLSVSLREPSLRTTTVVQPSVPRQRVRIAAAASLLVFGGGVATALLLNTEKPAARAIDPVEVHQPVTAGDSSLAVADSAVLDASNDAARDAGGTDIAAETSQIVEPGAGRFSELAAFEDRFEARLSSPLRTLAAAMRSSSEIDTAAHRQVRRLQRRTPRDPRPSQLLAHDFARKEMWDQAVERYVIALSIRPELADERLDFDLANAVGRASLTRADQAAQRLLDRGESCLRDVDVVLASSLPVDGRDRLEAIAASIRDRRLAR